METNVESNRVKDLMYKYGYRDFSIFCAEVVDVFNFLNYEKVEFKHVVWEFYATFSLSSSLSLEIVLRNDVGYMEIAFVRKCKYYLVDNVAEKNSFYSLHELLIRYSSYIQQNLMSVVSGETRVDKLLKEGKRNC